MRFHVKYLSVAAVLFAAAAPFAGCGGDDFDNGGTAGSAGNDADGSAGSAGSDGSAGAAGTDGDSGSAGAAGDDGGAGSDGSTGTDAGDDGSDGSVELIDDCTGVADGTACVEEGRICLDEDCVTSRCGDGYLNEASGEECDNGDQSVEGCTDCRFDCKSDDDCKSEGDCSTDGTCDTAKHTCSGIGPVADDTACALADGDGGTSGVCKSGSCIAPGCGNGIVDEGEDCDEDDPGCTNCHWTCTDDTGCDDQDACNGKETCDVATHTCKAGTAVVCTDGVTGCKGTCESSTGNCLYGDADKDGVSCLTDCNDNDPNVNPSALECGKDGLDNDCDGKTDNAPEGGTLPTCNCWADSDKDGYAASSATEAFGAVCNGDGYTRQKPTDKTNTDCRESNSSVNPGQTAFQTTKYCTATMKLGGGCLTSSWDYNCDGEAEQQYTTTSAGCLLSLGTRCGGSGWVGSVPACGATGSYRSCKLTLGTKLGSVATCVGTIADKIQACR